MLVNVYLNTCQRLWNLWSVYVGYTSTSISECEHTSTLDTPQHRSVFVDRTPLRVCGHTSTLVSVCGHTLTHVCVCRYTCLCLYIHLSTSHRSRFMWTDFNTDHYVDRLQYRSLCGQTSIPITMWTDFNTDHYVDRLQYRSLCGQTSIPITMWTDFNLSQRLCGQTSTLVSVYVDILQP